MRISLLFAGFLFARLGIPGVQVPASAQNHLTTGSLFAIEGGEKRAPERPATLIATEETITYLHPSNGSQRYYRLKLDLP